jgi:hypothetical protein
VSSLRSVELPEGVQKPCQEDCLQVSRPALCLLPTLCSSLTSYGLCRNVCALWTVGRAAADRHLGQEDGLCALGVLI